MTKQEAVILVRKLVTPKFLNKNVVNALELVTKSIEEQYGYTCKAGIDFTKCHIHNDNPIGCIGCGNHIKKID